MRERLVAPSPFSLLAFAVWVTFSFATGCGATPAPSSVQTPSAPVEPRWEDAFDTMPELLVVIFPSALRSDRVYGPLLRRVIELARERSRVVAATRALDAMEDAEEIILGVRPESSAAEDDVIVVVRGVRADVDPVTLVDADGRALWTPGPSGRVRELVRNDASPSGADAPVRASLFELPGRTWVIAGGDARARARSAFDDANRRRRSASELASQATEALATIRIDGPSLVARLRALRAAGALGAVGNRLESVSFDLTAGLASLTPSAARIGAGSDGGVDDTVARVVKVTLSYANDDAAALAEATVHRVLEALARKKPEDIPSLAWLAGSQVTVERPARSTRITVTAPLPQRLVSALLRAGTAPLPAPEANSPP